MNRIKEMILENDRNIKNLSPAQENEINRNVKYVRAKGISLYDSEIFRKDLIELYFERSIRNETMDGSESQTLCDSFISNCPKYKLEPLLYTLYCFSSATLLYFVFDLFWSNPNLITILTIVRDVFTLLAILTSYFIWPRFALSSPQKRIFVLVLLCILISILIFATQNVHSLFILPSWFRPVYHPLFFITMTVLWNGYNRKIAVED